MEARIERNLSSRMPLDYPRDACSYARMMAIALDRQSIALRSLVSRGLIDPDMLAMHINDLDPLCRCDEDLVSDLMAGRHPISPRIALAIAHLARVDMREAAPHVEACPWMDGVFRPDLAGRAWITIAGQFDDAVMGAFQRQEDERAVRSKLEIRQAMDMIRQRMEGHGEVMDRDDPVVDTHAGGADARDPTRRVVFDDLEEPVRAVPIQEDGVMLPEVPSRPPMDAIGGSVMMSLSDTGRGTRFYFRGLMSRARMEMLEEVLGTNAWSFTPRDVFIVERIEGRRHLLVRLDLEIERRLGPRVLTVFGAPVRRKGLFSRLFHG